MVANYPYFGLPNYMRYMNPNAYRTPRPYPSPYPPHNNNNTKQIHNNYNTPRTSPEYKTNQNKPITNPQKRTHQKKEKAKQQESPPLFSFFGINLYFDDVLILCILFFLYNEKVNDPYLFFTLVLLLLT